MPGRIVGLQEADTHGGGPVQWWRRLRRQPDVVGNGISGAAEENPEKAEAAPRKNAARIYHGRPAPRLPRGSRRLIAAFLLAAASGAAQEQVAPDGPDEQKAQWLSSYTWSAEGEAIGGLSGIEVSDDGSSFVALSDRDGLTAGQFLRDADGRITGISAAPFQKLRHAENTRSLGPYASDSEGLAQAADGSLYVSFEGHNRIWNYPEPGAVPTRVPRPREFDGLHGNSGLEALAIDETGALYTLPERTGALDRPFPVYRYRNGTWDQPFQLSRQGDWQATGMDYGPDGRLYLLERDFKGVFGFVTQVRRFSFIDGKPDAGEVLLQSWAGQHDNLEGIAVWRGQGGNIRLTMVSDDNYRIFQRTEFVEYVVKD